MGKIIGIDLGTSNSACAAIMGGRPTMVPSAEGTSLYGKAFPSVVGFTKDGQMLVGEPARRQAVANPEGTISEAKRKMGTSHRYNVRGKEYSPEQISAFILQKIKRDAEAFLGEPVKKAVVTAPAYFNDNQRQATKDAGTIAGLEVVRVINEPTAASLAYGLDKEEEEKSLVLDFGGGTLDVTVMEFGGGVFEVKSTSGDTHLGGTDMDQVIVDHMLERFRSETGIDLHGDPVAMKRVHEEAERAKIELSTVLSTEINLPYIAADAGGPKHLTMTLLRSKLEELVSPIVERCAPSIDQAMKDAHMTAADIGHVILVGGPTRMPIVQRFIEKKVKKPERGVDPMECVAMGAAIQAGILGGEIKEELLLLDVTPLSLGVETLGGVCTGLIERNSTIPIKKSQIFSTAADFQTSVTIHVLQGERSMAADNLSLGQFNLVGIPPAPRGIPQIEVTFDIDANGILDVTAKDLGTGKQQQIKITGSTRLSDEEKERMIREADQFGERDRKRTEEVELRNQADTVAYTVEKTLSDLGDRIEKGDRERLQREVAELKEAIAQKDADRMKSGMETLSKDMQEVSTKLYQQVSAEGGKEEEKGKEKGEGKEEWHGKPSDTVDANYRVKDEKK